MKEPGENDFQNWLASSISGWTWNAKHQLYLYKFLNAVTTGKSKRLMIFMPPRHGKSEMVTIRYLAWRLEMDPKLNIILGCYNQKLANRFSRRIKRIVEENVPMAKDRRAVDEWETQAGGGVKAVGVGAGITGFGGKLIVIDDPVKNRAEAESRVRRENTWDWFNDDIYTRLEPDAAIILIQTRWHEDDLAGRLTQKMSLDGEAWDVVKLPGIAENPKNSSVRDPLGRKPGEALWPERFSVERLLAVKQQQGSQSFSALYQQSPVSNDGGLFKREWFTRIVTSVPNGLKWARGYDLAVSTKTTADYTASFRCAYGPDGTLYIADGFRRRIEYPEQRKFVIDRLRHEENTSHGIEKALHGQALVQDLLADKAIRGSPIAAIRVDKDKWTRALGWSALAEAGKVALVQGAWIDEFMAELLSFPVGQHDDQIDAVSIAVRMLAVPNKKTLHRFK